MSRAHESWGLEEPPDYVTFAKKLLSGGYFFRGEETPEVRYSGANIVVV